MPDLIDRAQQRAQTNNSDALNYHRARRMPEPEQLIVGGVVLCIDCDDVVQPARLAVHPNAARCVQCQTIYEGLHHG